METTPFTEKHITLSAKIHESASYNMSIEYSGITDEYLTICSAVGAFDISYTGELWMKGPQALAFPQKVTSSNMVAFVPGRAQYTCFPGEEGEIIDDLPVYCYESEKYLLVVSAANTEKDWNWCVSHNMEGAELENPPDNMAQLIIQGPKAILALQKSTDIDLSVIPYYTFTVGRFARKESVVTSDTGYIGVGGFELYLYLDVAKAIWKVVFEAGEELGTRLVGLGACDTLRLETGFCSYGNDLGDETSPVEIRLGWITKFMEGKEFINRPMLEEQRSEGTTRKLVGFEMIDRDIPHHGYEPVNEKGEGMGVATSGIMSPARKTDIGTGYVESEYAKVDTEIHIDVHGYKLKVIVVKPPLRKQILSL